MKRLKLAVAALFVAFTVSNVNAQDEKNPWAVGFGINTVDVKSKTDGFKDYFGTFEWKGNTMPMVSRLTVSRYFSNGLSAQLAGSINKINTIASHDDVDQNFWSIDANGIYDLNNAFGDTSWFDPYAGLGFGYQNLNNQEDFTLNPQLGFNAWFSNSFGLNFNTAYRYAFGEDSSDVFQHALGLVYRFGGKDTDGDGIKDEDDDCPEVPGIELFNGCPDTDGDGIKDSDDACPEVPGPIALNGCPDRDGDGVADKDDACPDTPGLQSMKGCPDTDRDGIIDSKDRCPKQAGPKENQGCPWGDKDNDGVKDNVDKCPEVPGVASNNGCPEVIFTDEAQAKLTQFARAIYFNSGKSTFRQGVTGKLDLISGIMKEYPKANFNIEGHTDSQGKASYNKGLSERRARAVLDYLASRGGISASRLTSYGYGEDYPIDTNATRAGRANNRRVEIKLNKK